MPTLHGTPLSPFVRKVMIALAEKAVSYEQDPVTHFALPDGFERLHPLKRIPVWTTDAGVSLPDSSVILQYLERVHPEPRLMPEDPTEAARALFLEEFGDTGLAAALAPVFLETLAAPVVFKREPNRALIEKLTTTEAPRLFSYLEAQLDGHDYFVGNRFSLADIGVFSPLCTYRHAGYGPDANQFPGLVSFVSRMLERPTIRALVSAEEDRLAAMAKAS